MITIKTLNKKSLVQYLSSDKYREGQVIPISLHRAKSHLQNPRLKEEDVLLILAEKNDELVGYLGVLPDDLYFGGQSIHLGWMSCLWVDERCRGQRIAQTLVHQCMESWQGNILLTEFTKEAEKLYQKTGFFDTFRTLNGMRYYIWSDLRTLLPTKIPVLSKYTVILGILDSFINAFLKTLRLFSMPKTLTFQAEHSNQIDKETADIIQKGNAESLFVRGVNELQWILDYPWVLKGDKAGKEALRYHFSSFESKFECKAVKFRDSQGNIFAWVLYTCRNGHLRIPYIYSINDHISVRSLVYWLIAHTEAKMVTLFQKEIIDSMNKAPEKGALNQLHKKVQHRKILMSKILYKEIEGNMRDARIFDGDGDCAFT